MNYGSVCSGIEAASVAWKPLGWRPAFFSEIDPFPRAVLEHRLDAQEWRPGVRINGVPLRGDFTEIQESDHESIDLLVGGTPCQSFSVAGKRLGLDDPRGNLAIEYCRLARRLRPRWLVWENVPGVLSSNGGRDFGTFLGLLGECGYGFAYRVLDAQYVRVDGYPHAVPQRRRRVILVGYLGDWRRAAAVLFEPEGMRRDSPPRREAGKSVAGILGGSSQGGGFRTTDLDNSGAFIPGVARCVANGRNAQRYDWETETFVAHTLRGDGFDAGEDGTGRGTPLVPERLIAFDTTQITSPGNYSNPKPGDACHPLAAGAHPPAVAIAMRGRDGSPELEIGGDVSNALRAAQGGSDKAMVLTAFAQNQRDEVRTMGVAGALAAEPGMKQQTYIAYSIMLMNSGKDYKARETDVAQPLMAAGPAGGNQGGDYVATNYAVRRLTPRECERLQGFPDDHTAIPWRGKTAENCPDGPRYKAIGNSMAVNVMRWVGRRIKMVERITRKPVQEKML